MKPPPVGKNARYHSRCTVIQNDWWYPIGAGTLVDIQIKRTESLNQGADEEHAKKYCKILLNTVNYCNLLQFTANTAKDLKFL
jgi:hypothetical protein